MQKDFSTWFLVKEDIHANKQRPNFGKREVWWCSLGINVGDEQDGRGEEFLRPVLILKKLNKNIFIGLPLTTQNKEKSYFYKTKIRNKDASVILSQIRLIDSKRLHRRMERMAESEFEKIKTAVKRYIFD